MTDKEAFYYSLWHQTPHEIMIQIMVILSLLFIVSLFLNWFFK